MKRFILLILVGVGIGYLAYAGIYQMGTARHREISSEPVPELAWLKTEFGLSGEEYKRISELHRAYLPECRRMCALIAEKNETIKDLMEKGQEFNKERKKVIEEAVLLRAECRQKMLDHFYKVSHEMQPEARERYLDWVLRETMTPSHAALEETLHHHP